MIAGINLGKLLRRQLIPVGVSIGVGLIVLLQQFISNPDLNAISATLVAWGALVAAFALLLGLVNVLRFHVLAIARRERQMFSSLLIVVTAIVVFAITLPSGGAGAASRWVLRYLYGPLEASFLALLVFFIASAVYRGLNRRTWEVGLFALSALVVLIGTPPLLGVISPWLPAAREWVVNVPALAGVRGIMLGVALGVIATGLRLLTGIDRPYSE